MKIFKIILILTLPLILAPNNNNQARNKEQTQGSQQSYYQRKYQEVRTKTPQPFASGATRGPCSGEFSSLNLQPLAPSDHSALTTNPHPTFFWHIQLSNPRSIKFSLVEVGAIDPIYEKTFHSYSGSNLMQVTIPSHLAPLQPGTNYKWIVSVICNPKRPSANYFYSIPFSVVEPITVNSLDSQPFQKAIALAKAGIWYDAIYLAKISEDSQLFRQLLLDINIFLPLKYSEMKKERQTN